MAVVLMVLGMACMFGGVPTAFLIVLLRINRPERRARVWSALLVLAMVWSVIGATLAVCLVQRFFAAEGMEGAALVSIQYPLWLVLFGPAVPVLSTLWIYRLR
jgi:hypothetical protein